MNSINDYNLWIVLVSYLVSVVGAFVSLNVSDYVRRADGRLHPGWITLASVTFGGCAIWAMHFVGMLAYQPGVPITYDINLTLISLAIPIVFTFGGFYTVYHWHDRAFALLAAGAILGIGVATMHYTGMAAMRVDAVMTHVTWIVAVSVVIAVVASIVALHVFVHWKGYARQLSPFLMGIAVCGMHYTGMAAMRLHATSGMTPADYFQGAWNRSTMELSTAAAVACALAVGATLVTTRQLTDIRRRVAR